ncbi:MAG: tyrosine--tRNA ligase [Microscillaceae bacterium]|nr:tyrosine--tRNA ligase [Microscillaceae bacterium]
MPQNFVAELRWRGMVQDLMPETEAYLMAHITPGYVGFDPTADSLHIGNLVPIMLLSHYQRAGHKPIALIGGATGMIGDPSGKSKERNLLSEEALRHNVAAIRRQLEKFLVFDQSPTGAELVNNYDWYQDFKLLDFLRQVGKHLTVNYMMAKDSVKNRMGEGSEGISFTEFSYQLFQGYDFYYLYQQHQCRLQMGGSDQWGNITTGTELIRRMAGGSALALTCPLLTKSNGEKFGKSEAGNVWLDAAKTSPYKFYQFWLNVSDEDLPRLLRFFTLFDQEQIAELEARQNPVAVKKILAQDISTRVHSAEAAQKAASASDLLFGKASLEDFEATDEATLAEVFEGVPQKVYTRAQYKEIGSTVDLLAETTESSKGEIRRMIKNNGISINQEKLSPEKAEKVPDFSLLKAQYLLAKKGKQFFLVKIEA